MTTVSNLFSDLLRESLSDYSLDAVHHACLLSYKFFLWCLDKWTQAPKTAMSVRMFLSQRTFLRENLAVEKLIVCDPTIVSEKNQVSRQSTFLFFTQYSPLYRII